MTEHAQGELFGTRYDVRKCITASGAAITKYKQLMSDNITIYAPPYNIYEHAKESYYGGLTGNTKIRVLANSSHKIYYIDINSSYPASMLGEIPTNYVAKTSLLDESNNPTIQTSFVEYYLYSVKISYPQTPHFIPNIPVRSPTGKLYQNCNQTDTFRWRWGVELQLAQTLGATITADKCLIFEHEPIFNQFITELYNLRLEAKRKAKDADFNI